MIGIGLYVKESSKAVPYYMEVFGLELGYHVKNADGSYFHSELTRNGEPFLSIVESPYEDTKDNIVNLGVTLNSPDEVRSAFCELSRGGSVQMPPQELPWSPCGAQVTDRFGVWWYLTCPQHRPDDSFDPDTYTKERTQP